MAVSCLGNRGSRIWLFAIGIIFFRFVEAITPPADLAMIRSKQVYCFWFQVMLAIECSLAEKHLIKFEQIRSVREQTGVTCYLSENRRAVIVHIAPQQLPPE